MMNCSFKPLSLEMVSYTAIRLYQCCTDGETMERSLPHLPLHVIYGLLICVNFYMCVSKSNVDPNISSHFEMKKQRFKEIT